jgi:catechol 2,3-dioxygenase-like lactoylglutathione lyase family enzyme
LVSNESRLSHLFSTVGDLAAARAFWTEAIGLQVVLEDDEYVRVAGDGGFTMGIERARDGEQPGVEVVVRVTDVDAAYQRLVAAGIECDGPPRDMPWGARHIWLRDPDGRPVSIYSATDPDGK